MGPGLRLRRNRDDSREGTCHHSATEEASGDARHKLVDPIGLLLGLLVTAGGLVATVSLALSVYFLVQIYRTGGPFLMAKTAHPHWANHYQALRVFILTMLLILAGAFVAHHFGYR